MATSDLTKKALAESLKKFMRMEGIEKIKVEDICEDSNVSRRSFYRYFLDKYDLLTWTYNDDFCRMVEVRPDKTIWDYYPEILQYIHQDPQFFKNAFSYTGQNSFRYFCFEKLYPLIMNDWKGKFTGNERLARFAVQHYVYAAFDGYVWWLSQPEIMPWEDYMELSMGIIRDTAEGIVKSFQNFDEKKQEDKD